MTFTDPTITVPDFGPIPSDPINTLIGGQINQGYDPIIQNLANSQTALQRVNTQLGSAPSQFSPTIQQSLTQLQQQRIAKGQAPLTAAQFMNAAQAATTGQAVTQPPQDSPWSLGSFYHNAVQDALDIGAGLPKLPVALLNEAKALPQLPGAISKATQAGSPLDDIAALARAPGIRFIPGAYTVGNIASGDFNTIASHPLMTFLDILPGAEKAAGLTDVGKLAQAADVDPLRANLFKTASTDEAGNPVLAPGRLGNITQALGQTQPGQFLRETFGTTARATSSIGNLANSELERLADPNSNYYGDPEKFDPQSVASLKATTKLASDAVNEYGITPERHSAIMDSFQTGDLSDLTDNELAFRQQAMLQRQALDSFKLNNNMLVNRDGFLYLPQDGARLTAADSRLASRTAAITGDILPRLEAAAENDPRVANLVQTLHQAVDPNSPVTYADSLRLFNNLTKQRTAFGSSNVVSSAAGPAPETSLAAVANVRQGLRDAVAAERTVARLDEQISPAAVKPLIQRQVDQALIDRYATPDTFDQVQRDVLDRNFAGIPGFNASELRNFQDDISRTWRSLYQQAIDSGNEPPIYMHQVTPARAALLDYPRISDRETAISSLKDRTLDYAPYVHDVTVSLRHEAFEIVRQQGEQAAAREIIGSYGAHLYPTGDDPGVLQRFMPQARALAENHPTLDVMGIAKQLMAREMVPYDPSAYSPYITPEALGIPSSTDNPIMLPRVVGNTMEKLFGGEKIGPIAQSFNPIMKVFRTAVLPLSPRWFVNATIGHAIMLMARTDPLTVWKYLGDAKSLMDNFAEEEASGEYPRELMLRIGSRDVNQDIGLHDQLNVRGGYTMGRIFKEIQDSKAMQAAKSGLDTVVQKSYDLRTHIDDMGRAMAYMYGYDKSLGAGMTEDAAKQAGVELMRKTLITWDNITPMERSIVRSIFPFYGFVSHMMRYILNYPGDHPIRTSILAQVARNEQADQGTGLPNTFLNSFFFGGRDASGNQSAINTSTLNPFADVANHFTLAGFVAGLNPGLSTILQSLGVDTSKGAPELYPQLSYDPETGQLKADTNNPILGLLQNVIPQSRLLTELLGTSDNFKATLRTNPAAAMRLVQSQLGLPTFYRSYNVPQEIAKAEVLRETQQQTDFNAALKTGDYSQAAKWPGLIPLINQVHALQAQGGFKQLTPTTQQVSTPDLLVGAGSNVFTGG